MKEYWWTKRTEEKYWIEVTDRIDLGSNLKAPQTDKNGKSNWHYSMIKELKEGDIVFHYDKNSRAIVGQSRVEGSFWEDEIIWGSRGTAAREEGIKPHLRDGFYLGLDSFHLLSNPISMQEIGLRKDKLLEQKRNLEAQLPKSNPLYFPFELGEKRPPRPLQGYIFKLPLFFIEEFKDKEEKPKTRSRIKTLGAPYRKADEDFSAGKKKLFEIDPAIVERGNIGHAKTQNALAQFLSENNLEARSPKSNEPNYDLSWKKSATLYVAEIKSITPSNQEKQLRLGLGQVLQYKYQLSLTYKQVIGVLAVEREPKNLYWIEICKKAGIHLIWPEAFEKLLF